MWKDELALILGVVTLIAPLAGTARYGRHLATHPEAQLDRSIGPVLRRTEDIAAWVAVASRHEDGAAPGFNAKVRGQGSWPGLSQLPPPPVPDRGPAWLVSPRRRRLTCICCGSWSPPHRLGAAPCQRGCAGADVR